MPMAKKTFDKLEPEGHQIQNARTDFKSQACINVVILLFRELHLYFAVCWLCNSRCLLKHRQKILAKWSISFTNFDASS